MIHPKKTFQDLSVSKVLKKSDPNLGVTPGLPPAEIRQLGEVTLGAIESPQLPFSNGVLHSMSGSQAGETHTQNFVKNLSF